MGLRVLVIDAFWASPEGRKRFKVFLRTVAWAIKQANDSCDFHVIVRALTELQEFVFDPDADHHTQRQALRNFASIDLTFVGGEPSLLPWHTHSARLVAYLNQCTITGGRVCGDVAAARALWHLACTCGRQIHVVDILENPDVPAAIEHQQLPKAYAGRNTVMLQEVSGEAFQFTEIEEDGKGRDGKHLQNGDSHTQFRRRPSVGEAKKFARAVRCCNLGMKKRPNGASPGSSMLNIAASRGMEEHWMMKDLLLTANKRDQTHTQTHTVQPKPPAGASLHKGRWGHTSRGFAEGKGGATRGAGDASSRAGSGKGPKGEGKADEDGPAFTHKFARDWDLNWDLRAKGQTNVDPIKLLQGLAFINFTCKLGQTSSYRGQSAKCRQPSRAISVLAYSQYGPEIFESNKMLMVHFEIVNTSPLCRNLLALFVKRHVADLVGANASEGTEGASARRDAAYCLLMHDSVPLLRRFTFAVADGRELETLSDYSMSIHKHGFGGGIELMMRQLYREGTIPKISGPGSHKVGGVSSKQQEAPQHEGMLMATFPKTHANSVPSSFQTNSASNGNINDKSSVPLGQPSVGGERSEHGAAAGGADAQGQRDGTPRPHGGKGQPQVVKGSRNRSVVADVKSGGVAGDEQAQAQTRAVHEQSAVPKWVGVRERERGEREADRDKATGYQIVKLPATTKDWRAADPADEPVKVVKRLVYQKGPYSNFHRMQRELEQSVLPSEPYRSIEQVQRAEDMSSRAKWVSHKDFSSVPKKNVIQPLLPYINLTPWPGDPNSYFAKVCMREKSLPSSHWVDERGMRFNFKAKS